MVKNRSQSMNCNAYLMNEDAQQKYFTVLKNYNGQVHNFFDNDPNCFKKYLISKKRWA